MAYIAAAQAYADTTTNGFTVKETTTTTALASADGTKTTYHNNINTYTDNILGKTILVGVDIKTTGYSNGTAAAGGSMTMTFDSTESTISGTPDGKIITLESADGEQRTYTIRERVAATYADNMDWNGFTTGTDRVSFTVPVAAGGEGTAIFLQLCNDTNGSTSAGSGVIGVGTSGASASTVAEAVRDAINGNSNSRVHFGSGTSASGIVGLDAAIGTSGTKVSLTATNAGTAGNDIAIANAAGDAATAGNLSGGTGVSTISENEFNAGTTATETATNFKAAVDNATHGHGTARFTVTANATAGQITIVNVTTGTAGNTAISGNFGDICSVDPPSNMSGGTAGSPIDLGIEFSHNGTDWTAPTIVTTDIGADVTGVKLFEVDLTDKSGHPYARIVLNTKGSSMAGLGYTTGTHSSIVVYK
jgi:hypothetical protein